MKRRTDDGSGEADGAEDATMVYGIEGKPPKGFPRTGRTKPSNVQTELAARPMRSAAVRSVPEPPCDMTAARSDIWPALLLMPTKDRVCCSAAAGLCGGCYCRSSQCCAHQ